MQVCLILQMSTSGQMYLRCCPLRVWFQLRYLKKSETEEVAPHTPNSGFTMCIFRVFELQDNKPVRYLCWRQTRLIGSERLTHKTA